MSLEVRVNCYIHAPNQDVFALLADHGSYDRWPGIRRSKLLQTGSKTTNGTGALRAIHTDVGMWFEERITAFDAPHSFAYLIERTNGQVKHHGGRVQLHERGAGTEVDWVSRFDVAVPLIGRVVGKHLLQPLVTAGFMAMLIAVKDAVESA